MPAERWGVIADDVTGACDVAAELRELGLEVAVVLGVPEPTDLPRDADVVVVGLGTRTAPREVAVGDSLAAARALSAAGYERWYQKYCSTFDSTDEGMIGPVAEALADESGAVGSAGTPASPHADRTVYRGHLFVGDQLLSESSLAHHPLTPMTDPDLVRVLARQSTRPVSLVDRRVVERGAPSVAQALADTPAGHVLVDAIDDADLDVLAEALDTVGRDRLAGGGAGLMTAIGRRLPRREAGTPVREPEGEALILAGSASDRTREQLAHVDGPDLTLDAVAADRDADGVVETAVAAIATLLAAGRTPVISAGHDRARVAEAQQTLGPERAAAALDRVLGGIAVAAARGLGVRRLLVAGGETSGAVMRALGVRALRLTRRVDAGVAWAVGTASAVDGSPDLAVLLKSGNFGGPDLFTRAFER